MAYKTLENVLIDANSTLDLEAALPTGSELTLRGNFANQAVMDAAATGQFSEFKSEYLAGISTNATLPLPSGFRELQENPQLWNGTSWTEFPEIEVEEKYSHLSSEYFCYVLGNPASGYNLIFNSPIANATVSVIYQRFPSGLLTLTDAVELSDPTYVTRKVESYVLYARSDDKFQVAEARAQSTLLNMAGREMKGSGGQSRDTKSKMNNPLS